MDCAYLVILDRSGSMATIKSDAEGALAGFVEEQRNAGIDGVMKVVVFNHASEVLVQTTPLANVPAIELSPRGSTALLDTVGSSVAEFYRELAAMENKPDKVLVIIITDGEENASYEYSHEDVKNIISQREEAGWQFIFLAANQDAIASGARIGVDRSASMTFSATTAGVRNAAKSMSGVAASYVSDSYKGFSDEDRAGAVDS